MSQKNRLARFCADRAQNLPGPAATVYSECLKFHPNPLTSGRVIAKCVNTIQMRHKVFPILGEGIASSVSNKAAVFVRITVGICTGLLAKSCN